MKRAQAKKGAFNQILKRLEAPNAERLVENAPSATRIAKAAADARARRRAYHVKVDALLTLRRCFPTHTSVTTDLRIPSFVIVKYASPPTRVRCGLHAPASAFVC